MPGKVTDQLSNARLDEVAELAEIVAEEHCPRGRIEPEKIAANKGITVSFGNYGQSFDGLLEHDSGRFHIYCNLDRARARESGRARFTLAHELGHFFIDDHRNALAAGIVPAHPSKCDFQSRNPVEAEADHFASTLLMPAARFVPSAVKQRTGLRAILALAESFGTSATSTALRYVRLDVARCAVVKWNPEGFAWKWCSHSLIEAGYRGTIRDPEQIPEDAPTQRAMRGESPAGEPFFHCGTVASAWFPAAWAGTQRDILLIEEAIRLGQYGVLTLLYPESAQAPGCRAR